MRPLVILALVLFNGFAAHRGSAFFTTFAELPSVASIAYAEPVAVAAALGHAYHAGGESMRNFLGGPFMWLCAAAVVNLAVAVFCLLRLWPSQRISCEKVA